MTPFTLAISDTALTDLRERLVKTRFIADVFAGDEAYGASVPFAKTLVEHWRDRFDWRAHEARINRQPQLMIEVDGLRIHTIHRRSARADAMPLILLHGWPSSLLEFVDICDALADPPAGQRAFHVIIPSLPGYGFSTTRMGLAPQHVATLLAELMRRLGYDRYMIQGGNWGSLIGTEMTRQAPNSVIGLHLNSLSGSAPPEPLPIGAEEQRYLDAQQPPANFPHFVLYTKSPASLAHAMNDSPAGLAAWVCHWLRDWADKDWLENPGLDPEWLVSTAAFYWLSGSIATSSLLYYELVRNPPAERFVTVPTAIFLPKAETVRLPRAWAERLYTITRWTLWPKGGHFPAVEIPDAFVADIRAFAGSLR